MAVRDGVSPTLLNHLPLPSASHSTSLICLYSHRPSPWPCYSHPSSPHHILARPHSLSPRIGQPWSPRIKANVVRSDLPPRQCGSSKRCGVEWEGSYGIYVPFMLFKLFINIDLSLPPYHLWVCNISVVKRIYIA